jgi:preprotein translocase subunit SecG
MRRFLRCFPQQKEIKSAFAELEVYKDMVVVSYVLGSLLLIVAAALIVLVLFQSAKKRGLSGAVGGTSADSFFGKNQSQTKEKKLSRFTTILTAVFAVLAIVAYIVCI